MSFENLVGQTFGQYELQDLLGAGGMGAVYRASQRSLKRLVAVKVLSPAIAEQPGYLERFNREAEVSAALEHKHIVPVYDYGVEQNTPYIVMRLLTGGSLAQRLQQVAQAGRTLPTLYETSSLLKQLASALDYAHSRGVIHRDIKPGNVMFDNLGDAYLVDFGIAKLLDAMTDLTGTGGLGTPSYMPPEQWRSEELTSAADQYALGVAIYNMLTGQLPFDAATPFQMMHKHLNELPTPLRAHRNDLSPAVELVLERALRKMPQERFPTVTSFAQAFDAAIEGAPAETTGFFDFRLAGSLPSSGGTPLPSRRTQPPATAAPITPAPTAGNNAPPPPPPPTAGRPTAPPPPPPRRGGTPWLPIALTIFVLLGGLALVVSQILPSGTEPIATSTAVAVQPTSAESHTPTRQALIINTPAPATSTLVPSATSTPIAANTVDTPASVTPGVQPSASPAAVSVAAVSTSTEAPVSTAMPDDTATPIPTATPSHTTTSTSAPTETATLTSTSTSVPTEAATSTPENTATPIPTETLTTTPSPTPTHTATLAPTATWTLTPSPVPSNTPTPEPTLTWTPMPSATTAATNTPLPTETLAPQMVAAALDTFDNDVQVTFQDNFDGEALSSDWEVWSDEPTLADGELSFTGQGNWNNAIVRGDIDPNEGILILFQSEDDLRMEFNLQNGSYETDEWRNWTFARYSTWEAAAYYGAEDANSMSYASPYLESGVWYYLLFRISEDGTFYTQVWERDNPAYYHVNVATQPPEVDWNQQDWDFVVHLNSGTLRLDRYQELSFPAKYTMPDTPPNLDGVPTADSSQATEAALSTQAANERPDVLAFCDDPDGGETPPSDIEAGEMIDVYWFWSAETPELLQQHVDNVIYEVRVDDQRLDEWLLYREPLFRVYDGAYYQYWSVPFGPLAAGKHEVSFYVTWTATISNGYSDFGPGSDTPEWSSTCTFTVD